MTHSFRFFTRIAFIFIPFLSFVNIQAQNMPEIAEDSVRYKNKMYSFTWHDGFQKGLSDGKMNQFDIQEIGDTTYLVKYNNDKTIVSKEWAAGYSQGYAAGILKYQLKNNDSVMYNGKMVSREWYDNHVEYETAFMPGISYNFIVPNLQDSLGYFHGVGIEYLFFASVTQNDNPGPSHVRFYGRLNLLKSSRGSIVANAFAYTLGIDLSLEKNPKRSFLVPYFGLEAGGISQKDFGNVLQFTPTFGIHVLSKKNIFASIQGGYMYPTKHFDELRGYSFQASMNIAFW